MLLSSFGKVSKSSLTNFSKTLKESSLFTDRFRLFTDILFIFVTNRLIFVGD